MNILDGSTMDLTILSISRWLLRQETMPLLWTVVVTLWHMVVEVEFRVLLFLLFPVLFARESRRRISSSPLLLLSLVQTPLFRQFIPLMVYIINGMRDSPRNSRIHWSRLLSQTPTILLKHCTPWPGIQIRHSSHPASVFTIHSDKQLCLRILLLLCSKQSTPLDLFEPVVVHIQRKTHI